MAEMVITGNRLGDGAVVWRDAAGDWATDFAAAAIYATAEDLAGGLEAARADETRGSVIGVYEAEVETRDGRAVPVRLRERIRADGPTVAFG